MFGVVVVVLFSFSGCCCFFVECRRCFCFFVAVWEEQGLSDIEIISFTFSNFLSTFAF